MHFIPALKASNMELIHFLSDCPSVIYDKVLKVEEKYGRLEITGQNASKKTLKTGLKATVDFPSYNFEYLRGDLTKEEIISLLNGLLEGKSPLSEVKQESMQWHQGDKTFNANSTHPQDAKTGTRSHRGEQVILGYYSNSSYEEIL